MGMRFLFLLETERSCPKAQQNTLLFFPLKVAAILLSGSRKGTIGA